MALVAELVEAVFEILTVGYYKKKNIKFKNTNNSKNGKRRKRNRRLLKMQIM